jgi:preprotein translocase subunit SecE
VEMVDKSKSWLEPKIAWLRESWLEVRHKVTWPSKEEVWGTTRVVLVTVLVFAVIVGTIDAVLGQLLRRILGMFA